ncbi:MAG: hypothetical protein SFW35_03250 [Chitinophagales bacterium]|nr:hypothetical protein [Chitinophagales bacterium]
MSLSALPWLFNGLFFSISPAPAQQSPAPTAAITQAMTSTVKVQVNFYVDEHHGFKLVSVNSSQPVNTNVLKNIDQIMLPQVLNQLATNRTYTIMLELKVTS